jgi:WD40 repeat protein
LRRIDELGGPAHTLAFSPDGTRLFSGGRDSSARTWDVATGRPLGEPIKHRNWVESITIAPDGRLAASAGQDSLIRVWDTTTSEELSRIPAHEFWLWSAAISPDGATAFTSAFDDTIRIWESATGRQRQVLRIPDRLIAMALSPDGRVLAASIGRPGEVRLLDPDSGRELRRLHGHARGVYDSLALSRDGSRIVAAGAEDQTVRLWEVATGRSLRIFKHPEDVRAAAISPDGTIVAGAGFENRVGGKGRVIRIWDATTGGQIRELRGHKEWANVLAFSPDGKQLASGGHAIRQGIGDGGRDLGSADLSDAIHLWDVATGADLRQFPGEPAGKWGDARSVNGLAFTPDGRTLVSGEEDGSIVLYDAASAAVRATLRGHLSGVRAVRVSADGRRLVSASTDLTALVWDLGRILEAGGSE